MSALLHDLRFGYRNLAKSRGFTLVALATLAIGIGANTAIFSFVNGVLLKPLPYAEPERIVRVLEKHPSGGPNGISTLNYLDWARDNTVFEHIAALTGELLTLTGTEEPVQLRSARVTAQYFEIFGIRPALGRAFARGEDQAGREKVVVLTHALWQSQFGGATDIIGRSLLLDGEPHTVIGVMPRGSAFERNWPQLWRPLVFTPDRMTRDFHWFGAVAQLKPGVTLEQARANMDAIGARIAQDHPASNKNWGVVVNQLAETVVGPQLRQSLYVLLGAVAMVLLIGCANLANLSLARGLAREREVAIRASLGAGRWRLVRQFLTESVLLSVVGGLLGLGLGFAMLKGLQATLPSGYLPSEAVVTIDGRVLVFTLTLAVLTGIVFGVFPAWQATRPDLANAMKQGSAGSGTGRSRHRVRSALVVAEVALAFVLLTGAGLLIRSFARLQTVDTGFDPTYVVSAGLPMSEKRFPTTESFQAYLEQITAAVAAVPGVRDVALTSSVPMRGWGYGMPFQIADQPTVDVANRPSCYFKMVSPSYFQTLRIRLIRGRTLSERDVKGSPPALVINETMARKHFADADPLGKRLLIQEIAFGKPQLGPDVPWEVVGIVADEKVGDLDDKDPSPGVYVTHAQSPQLAQALLVRGATDPTLLQRAIQQAVYSVNKDQALTSMMTLEQIKIESLGPNRFRSLLLGLFASVALLLASIGLYGVVSYSVAQRTREIGIRAALGANTGNILGLILRGGMTMVVTGLLLGAIGVFALTRLLSSLLYGVGERDPATIAGVAAILASVALVACYLPARRATRVDPIIALRCD
ncbi:MAG TPA: ABC transporter permease [Opitutaceae bacterium]